MNKIGFDKLEKESVYIVKRRNSDYESYSTYIGRFVEYTTIIDGTNLFTIACFRNVHNIDKQSGVKFDFNFYSDCDYYTPSSSI
jgi:hypothetical protein